MTLHHTRTFSLALSLFLFCGFAPSQAADDPLAIVDFSSNQRITSTQQVNKLSNLIDVQVLKLRPIKERLMAPAATRQGAFGNSHVDIAPKSWPYPMVFSPLGKPVLPGSAW